MTQRDSSTDTSKTCDTVWPLTKAAFGLLTTRELWTVAWLVALILVAGGLDIFALAMVMPVVTIIIEPSHLSQSSWATWIMRFFESSGIENVLFWMAVVAAGMLIGAYLLNLLVLRLGNQFSVNIQARLTHELMEGVLRAPYGWHVRQNTTELVRFFNNDVAVWGQSFIFRLIQLSQHVLGMVLPVILLMIIVPTQAAIGLLIIGGAGVAISKAIKPKMILAGKTSKEVSKKIVNIVNNAVAGIKDVKLSCVEESYTTEFSDLFKTRAQARAGLAFWPVAQNSGMMLLGQLALLGLATLLFLSGLPQDQIAGQMALIVMVVSRVLPSANRFFGLYSTMWSVLPWVEEVVDKCRELRTVTPEIQSNEPAVNTGWDSVRCDEVGFKYPGQTVPALNSVSCKFSRGGLYGVVGESGAGKSTLIDLVIGLHEPSKGRIVVDDQDLRECDTKSWHQQIGYVPQFPYLADGTVAENVALGMPVAKVEEAEVWEAEVWEAEVWEALELANLAEFVRGLPEGLETPVGDRGVRFSGGQRQRLAIARALFQKPRLLVLDEATSSLDQIAETEIRTALEKLHGRITVILIAHRMTTVQDCDEILFLSKGKLEAHGRYEELLEKHEGFRRLADANVDHPN